MHGQLQREDILSTDPAELVEEAVRQVRQRLEALGFSVEIDVPGTLPPISVDRPAILHALDNFLDNAIKYSPAERTVAIRAYVNDNDVSIEVSDMGIGIPPEETTRVFDKFYRAGNATADGNGLGLAIAARIIEAHKGTIDVVPRPEHGTTIRVSLPIAS